MQKGLHGFACNNCEGGKGGEPNKCPELSIPAQEIDELGGQQVRRPGSDGADGLLTPDPPREQVAAILMTCAPDGAGTFGKARPLSNHQSMNRDRSRMKDDLQVRFGKTAERFLDTGLRVLDLQSPKRCRQLVAETAHGFDEEPFLVAEMTVDSAAGAADLCNQVIERKPFIAPFDYNIRSRGNECSSLLLSSRPASWAETGGIRMHEGWHPVELRYGLIPKARMFKFILDT